MCFIVNFRKAIQRKFRQCRAGFPESMYTMGNHTLYKNLLLIDDDPDDAELLREALTVIDPSISLEYYHNEELAMESLLKERALRPDLIMLDINLYTLSGLECLRLIKKDPAASKIPVVIYTTSSQAQEKEISYKLGADGYLTKPTDFKILQSVLGLILSTPAVEMRKMLDYLPKPGAHKDARG